MIILLKNIYFYIRPYKSRAIVSILLALVLAGIKGLYAYLIKPLFDNGLSTGSPFSEALFYGTVLVIAGLVNFPARFFHFYLIRFVVDRVVCNIRNELYAKFQTLPMSFYTASKQGRLISNLLNDTIMFSNGFRSAIDLIREPVTAIILLGVAIYHDWILTLVILAVTPLFILIFQKSGKLVKNIQGEVQEEISHMTHNAAEGLAGQKMAKAFNLQSYVKERFSIAQEKYFSAQMRTTFVEEMAHPFVEVVGSLAFAGVVVLAWYRIQSGALTQGGFISFCAALALLMDPIRKFSQANVKLNQARAGGTRIFHILKMDEEADKGSKEVKGFNQTIEIKNLTFSYGERYVLKDFSITIEKGQKIALVGLSGSGKTTLINLLLGLYPIEEGDILIDGVSISDIKLSSIRGIFGLVSQDIFLFHDTVRENLVLGEDGEKCTKDMIQKALDVAYATEFVEKLPDGIETVIGDRGMKLSGGQQQRLTMARAFLRNNDVFLFDEATSALDNESEKVVQKALDSISSNKTVVSIAHRLSSIQDYDQIFVMDEGKLVEQGTHDELMGLNGSYSKLYELAQRS